MIQLYEKYRPTCWDEVIGQDAVVGKLQALASRGLGGRSFYLSGNSGQGKTTIARLIAAEVADEWSIEECDSQGMTAKRVQELERLSQTHGMGSKSGRAIIINEAHGLTNTAVRQLLTTLERIPSHVVWIFTTTKDGENYLFDGCDDAAPLISRCVSLSLTSRGLAEVFAEHAMRVAENEGLGGKELRTYVRAAKDCRNNLRKLLQMVDSGDFLADDTGLRKAA